MILSSVEVQHPSVPLQRESIFSNRLVYQLVVFQSPAPLDYLVWGLVHRPGVRYGIILRYPELQRTEESYRWLYGDSGFVEGRLETVRVCVCRDRGDLSLVVLGG